MRTRYTLINMVVNVGGQLMNQVLLFISRMVFIHYLSAAYLGVNGLFTDVHPELCRAWHRHGDDIQPV